MVIVQGGKSMIITCDCGENLELDVFRWTFGGNPLKAWYACARCGSKGIWEPAAHVPLTDIYDFKVGVAQRLHP